MKNYIIGFIKKPKNKGRKLYNLKDVMNLKRSKEGSK